MRGDENGKRAIGKASRPSTGKDRDTSRAGGNYGVSDVTKQETCCLPMYAFIGPDETLRLDTTSNGHSPSTSCSAIQTGGPIKEEKHSSRIESRGQRNIFHSARLFFYTTKQCMGNGSEEKSKKKRGRPARQEGRNKKERGKKRRSLLLDGHALSCWRWTDTGFMRVLVLCSCGVSGALGILCAGFLLQEAAFLSRASALKPNGAGMAADAASRDLLALGTGTTTVAGGGGVIGAGRSGRQVRNVFGDGVLGANVGDTDV